MSLREEACLHGESGEAGLSSNAYMRLEGKLFERGNGANLRALELLGWLAQFMAVAGVELGRLRRGVPSRTQRFSFIRG